MESFELNLLVSALKEDAREEAGETIEGETTATWFDTGDDLPPPVGTQKAVDEYISVADPYWQERDRAKMKAIYEETYFDALMVGIETIQREHPQTDMDCDQDSSLLSAGAEAARGSKL